MQKANADSSSVEFHNISDHRKEDNCVIRNRHIIHYNTHHLNKQFIFQRCRRQNHLEVLIPRQHPQHAIA